MRTAIAYAELCDVADAAGLTVELFASPSIKDAPCGGEYRDLVALEIADIRTADERIAVCVCAINAGDLQTASRLLLEQLRRILARGSR